MRATVNQGIHNSVQGHALRLNIKVNSVVRHIFRLNIIVNSVLRHIFRLNMVFQSVLKYSWWLTILVDTVHIGAEVCRLNIVLTVYRGMLSG